jgi:serine/threonine protein kinase/tetratricopeptide (TPR) repeat protein
MSNASEPKSCPKCGGPIPAEAPQGLCPQCLMRQASFPTEAGQRGHAKSAPPPLAELAAAFPQLEILELIGQGGMGFVFKARQPRIERLVALKILPTSLAVDPAFAERFTREGRMLARLNHPNIVTLHDFGQAGGFFYLLMEFVDGVNLRQAMKVGRFTPAQALSIVPKVCEALEFAHNEGILHRDIKPENILLDSKGRVKIADFGIAKLTGETRPDLSLTASGTVLGTPHYMAPEQLEKSGDVDQRADIYSLGVVFYEMLTGELPLGRFQPPSEKVQMDVRLDEVVLHALEKEPARRYQHASQVKTAVETISANPAHPAIPVVPPPFVAAAAAPAQRPDRFWRWFAVVVLALIMIPVGVAVLGMLAAIVIPNFAKARSRALHLRSMAVRQTNTISNVFFGPVIERTLNRPSTGTNFLLSFKTGELRTPPPDNAGSIQEIYRWAAEHNVDAKVGIQGGDDDGLYGFNLAALPAPNQCWDELTPVQAAARLDQQDSASFAILFHGHHSGRETCAFKTRDGGIGILQLAEYVSDPPGVKIRYKFVDKVPAMTQTQSNAIAPEAWTPTLWPGEKPEPAKILEEAKKLTATGKFEEALQRYLWYHNHAQESGDSYQTMIRLLSALSDWEELGRRYPKARQKLIEVRDNKTREITEGRGYAELFQDVQAINHELQDDDATYALFKAVRDSDPKLTDQCFYYLQDLLVAKGEYQWCLRHLGDPQARFDSIRQSFQSDQARYSATASLPEPATPLPTNGVAVRPPRPVAMPAPPPGMAEMIRKSAEVRFVSQTCQLIEILIGAGRKAEAEEIHQQALAVLADPRLKSALNDAEERVRNNLHQ